MLNFGQAQLEKLSVHYVGNKQKQEKLKLTEHTYQLNDENVEALLKKYFTQPFKGDQAFCFTDMNGAVAACVQKTFDNPSEFHAQSKEMAQWLYECATHARIKGGEFYVAHFTNVILEEEVVDAIGIFKSENKDPFLKVYVRGTEANITADEGINIHKLDKGCIILNTHSDKGYQVYMLDNSGRIHEAMYWKTDFLNIKHVDNSYFATAQYMELMKSFSDDVLSMENNVPREEQLHFLRKSAEYFQEKQDFDLEEFKQEVIIEPDLAETFKEYKEAFEEEKAMPAMERFQISSKAVEKNSNKFFRSVIKLDKNFHIYVHGNANFIERGFDEGLSLNYYKLFYKEES